MLERVADDMVWQPDPFMGTVLRDPDELRAFAATASCPLELLEVEDHGQAVLMSVRLGDRDVFWVLHFRLGRRGAWPRSPSARTLWARSSPCRRSPGRCSACASATGWSACGASSTSRRPRALEKLLLRRREPGERRRSSTSPSWASWTRPGLRVLLRARQAAERGRLGGRAHRRLRSRCSACSTSPGVHAALPRRGVLTAGRATLRPRAVGVAQLVELLVVVQVVAGSSPVAHPSGRPAPAGLLRSGRAHGPDRARAGRTP